MATNRLYAETNTTMPAVDVIGLNKAGGACVSGDAVLCGQIPGVLQGDATSAGVGVMQKDGIYTLPVKGENQSGNAAIAEGAILYFDSTKAYLSTDTTKPRFGYALKGVASGATASIPVQVGY